MKGQGVAPARVLQIISDTNIGGAGRVVANYLAYADTGQYQIHVALPKKSLLIPLLKPLPCTLHKLEGLADRSFHREDVAELKALMEGLKPGVVHTHGAFSGRVAAKDLGIPVVFSRHSVFPVSWKKRYPPMKWFGGWVNCHYSDAMIAVNPAAADNLVEMGVPRGKITVIYNGVTPLSPRSPQENQGLKKKLGIGQEQFVFGILARLEAYKGHRLLLEAMESLVREGRACTLVVAGVGEEDSALKALVAEKKLEDRVKFLGFYQDVAGLLSILDVQVNASYGTEATSLALLEGMSLGVPALVSDFGGNPHVISPGKNGVIFESKNLESLKEAMVAMMDWSVDLGLLSQGAQEIFAQRFTGEIFARETQAVYRRLLDEKK